MDFASSSCSGVTEWKSGKNFIKISSDDEKYDVAIDVVSKGVEFKGKYEIKKPRKSLALLYPFFSSPLSFPLRFSLSLPIAKAQGLEQDEKSQR